ncbi:hypothetical protein D3C85_1912150 [compost metagenome]
MSGVFLCLRHLPGQRERLVYGNVDTQVAENDLFALLGGQYREYRLSLVLEPRQDQQHVQRPHL